MDKKKLRKEMSQIRKQISPEKIVESETKVMESLKNSMIYQNYDTFYIYVSYQKEFPTLNIIDMLLKDGKHVAVPKVMGEEMKFFEIRSREELQPGCMGILEPLGKGQECSTKGIVLVPGLAFDLQGGRMGYGGGFYDKYLSRYPDHITVGLLYEEQMIEKVPMEKYDHFLDYLMIPGKGIVNCR